jgi:hypothetical protein
MHLFFRLLTPLYALKDLDGNRHAKQHLTEEASTVWRSTGPGWERGIAGEVRHDAPGVSLWTSQGEDVRACKRREG